MKTGDQFNPYKIFNGCYIPFSLMECTELSSSAKLVYARLTAYAGQDGLAFPKHETLAKDLGFKSSFSVRSAIKELVNLKLIEPVKSCGKDKLFHKSNQYKFLWNDILSGSLKTSNLPSNPINTTESNILLSEEQDHIPPKSNILLSDKQHIAFLYKDEKNHIEKNHKEKNSTTSNEVVEENGFSSSPQKKKELISKKETNTQWLARVEAFELTTQLIEWGENQNINHEDMQAHYDFYVDYLANIEASKRKKDLAAQFRNCVRANWANVKKQNQAKSWQQQNNEATEKARDNFLKMIEGEHNGSAKIDYFS